MAASSGTDYAVYFLGGQSNMEGYGFNTDLPDALKTSQEAVRIFAGQMVADGEDGGGIGLWAPIGPGFGSGFWTDGRINRLSDRFGPELAFAARLAELEPDRKIAIIKYARGGSSLELDASGYGTWAPEYTEANGRNQYDNALTAITEAMSIRDIDGDGYADRLIPAGIVWMQGEADAAHEPATAAAYEHNLARMMDLLRAALRVDDLPVSIGMIKDSGDTEATRVMTYSPEVQAAQKSFAGMDACADFVTESEDFSFLPDGWHYLSDDYLSLGRAFADSMIKLRKHCGQAQ